MARPRAFDPATVLTGAMHAFRRSGYAGASIRDLESATGLVAGSIYHAFGDKQGLFDAAFAHYLDHVLRRRIRTHAGEASGLGGVRRLFLSLLDEPGGSSFGCLITNSAIEFGAAGKRRAKAVREGFDILRDTLHERLDAARHAGRLRSGIDPTVAAVGLVAFYQGVLVLVRAGHDHPSLERAIELEFDHLERQTR